MPTKPAERLICLWDSEGAEGREVKSWFTNVAWWLTPVISRTDIKGWRDFWRTVGLSTAGKVSLCLCLPTLLHSITAAGHSGYSSHPVQPSPPIQPRSTHILTHRDHLYSIWEKFGLQFVLQILMINDYVHCLMVKTLCPLDALQCLTWKIIRMAPSICPTLYYLHTVCCTLFQILNMVYCSRKHIKI